ncbi:hypothetical protein [Microseira wollei]|uniref:Uncharacterized protein n=1 Tax=Microseira wollei NIES-4236 TaxID=2530354 RepID=A0AAV3X9Y4_9CYAN|nr:hypothetical protein [Microseira wollei]GET37451.1 hypothetical protein MiSe_22040 [Microseira wollei NIES-4236]
MASCFQLEPALRYVWHRDIYALGWAATKTALLPATPLYSQNPISLTAHLLAHPMTQFLTQQHLPLDIKVTKSRKNCDRG